MQRIELTVSETREGRSKMSQGYAFAPITNSTSMGLPQIDSVADMSAEHQQINFAEFLKGISVSFVLSYLCYL